MTHPTLLHELISTSPSIRPRTKQIYIDSINRFVAFAGDDPRGWSLAKTRAFYQHLLDTKMKPQSANNIMKAVTFAGKWYAIEVGQPAADFSRIQMAPDKHREARDAFTPDQARALLDTCKNREPRDLRDFAMMVTALETGMRRMSLASMAWDKIKRVPPVATVKLKGYDEEYDVPTSDSALAALGLWRTWLDGQRVLKKGPVWRALTYSLAGAAPGGGISVTSIYNIIRARATLIGIEAHPHIFRHTFITWRRGAGVPDHLIGIVTGHRLPGDNSVLSTYTDKKLLAEQARNTTPAWLAEYVKNYCRG